MSSEMVIHLVGIGGAGMSGVAEVLHSKGYKVQGSDQSSNKNVERLRSIGIKIFIGHKKKYVRNASTIVVSSAIRTLIPELVEAIKLGIPVLRRSDMLASIMGSKIPIVISGSHGKTTTTSLSSFVLETGGLDPTVVSGGIINSYKTSVRIGSSKWIVVEADESDGTFTRLPTSIAVVTNLDTEHLAYYGSMDQLKNAFRQFLRNVPPHGLSIISADQQDLLDLASHNQRLVSYGLSSIADIRAVNVRQYPEEMRMSFDIVFSDQFFSTCKNAVHYNPLLKDVHLALIGSHNVKNALGAISVAAELGIHPEHVIRAFQEFQGIGRRFEVVANFGKVIVVNDYAHHPTEISATLRAARLAALGKQVIALIQPHRYSRWKSLYARFLASCHLADVVGISPFYSAGEKPIQGIDSDHFANDLRKSHTGTIFTFMGSEDLVMEISKILSGNDYVIFMGAGDLCKFVKGLVQYLRLRLATDYRVKE